ncbi:hypothetical protein [Rhodohalobacter mucosus]|uniref:Uncharacterized protein n=1 Tax=Rhodohalobacter mucosus TaxID=2079485 RepID=A0A316TTV0_9BACT|nr:hypothetical protein [Rhodohalobacter mucosus]PWN07983.1 hypothetical protein DDZ15_02945 [Rhodohalobacter mucosus]
MELSRQNDSSTFLMVWRLALLSFILAGLTGFIYRLGLITNLPEGIEFANLRHAHSHLMFFNWICPPLMILMAGSVFRDPEASGLKPFRPCMITMIVLGFLTYPLFLMYGYQPVAVGRAEIPLAAAVSGLIMVTWYWFAWLYYRYRKERDDRLSLLLFDTALLALILSSLGAWGVTVAQFTAAPGSLIPTALTGFFLSVFTEGWVVLAAMGILVMLSEDKLPEIKLRSGWYYVPVLFGSMLLFPLSLSRPMLTGGMVFASYLGLTLAAAGLLIFMLFIWKTAVRSGFTGKAIVAFFSLKVMFLLAALMPHGIWPGEHGVRVLYLHTLLLGLASAVIIESFSRKRQAAAKTLFILSVCLILVTLSMISGHWPAGLTPNGLIYWVVAAAALPVIPAGVLLAGTFNLSEQVEKKD